MPAAATCDSAFQGSPAAAGAEWPPMTAEHETAPAAIVAGNVVVTLKLLGEKIGIFISWSIFSGCLFVLAQPTLRSPQPVDQADQRQQVACRWPLPAIGQPDGPQVPGGKGMTAGGGAGRQPSAFRDKGRGSHPPSGAKGAAATCPTATGQAGGGTGTIRRRTGAREAR